jgi:hypothetical protein
MNKYEKLIEYIINENEQKARELFHEIVVEKSRDIYESLMDEEQMGETFGGNGPEELANEIQGDHTGGIAEEEGEEEFSLDGEDSEDEDELGGDLPPTDMGGDDMGGDEPATKADIDELKDMFAEIQAQLDGGDSDMEPEEEPMGDMDSMDGPAEVGAEEPKFGEGMMEAEESDEDTEDDKEDKEDKDEVKEAKSNGPKSVAQLMREYVDQIGQVYGGEGDNAEGTESGNGKKVPVNTKSVTRTNGPDFGGTSKNLNRGGSEQSPDGKPVPKPNNEYSKGEGKLSNEKFQNAPGGSKKTSPVGKNWESANSPEGQTTGGKVPVADKSVLKQNTGK